MLKFLRLYYNYFLVKWKIRKVLPAYFINRIETADCGERLVPYQGVFVRERVAAMLEKAQQGLPPHFELKAVSGFRDDAEQNALQKKFGNTQQVAAESGHSTGGAIDVILLHRGKEADLRRKVFNLYFGDTYLEPGFEPKSATLPLYALQDYDRCGIRQLSIGVVAFLLRGQDVCRL